mgnify:CR=1 FL=1
MKQKASPLHRWGWKLALRKNHNQAVAAVAKRVKNASVAGLAFTGTLLAWRFELLAKRQLPE